MLLTGRDVVLVEGARTPFGRSHPEKGWCSGTHPAAAAIEAGHVDALMKPWELDGARRTSDQTVRCGGLGPTTLLQRV